MSENKWKIEVSAYTYMAGLDGNEININDTFYILWTDNSVTTHTRDNHSHEFVISNSSNIIGWYKDEDEVYAVALKHKKGENQNE